MPSLGGTSSYPIYMNLSVDLPDPHSSLKSLKMMKIIEMCKTLILAVLPFLPIDNPHSSATCTRNFGLN